MVLFRALGWLLLAMAVGAVVYDGLVWWSEGALRLLPLGELWSRVDLDSMNRTQTAVQQHLSAGKKGNFMFRRGAAHDDHNGHYHDAASFSLREIASTIAVDAMRYCCRESRSRTVTVSS